MSADFSQILQSYLYYRNQAQGLGSVKNANVWPDFFPPLQKAWQRDVNLLKVRSEADGIEIEDLSEEVGCVGYKVGESQFWIPAPLCAFLPQPEIMSHLFKAATARRLFSGSSICISGSSVLMGVVPRVADLDLFEYVTDTAVKNELLHPKPQYREGFVVCKSVRVGQTEDGAWPTHSWKRDENDIFPEKMRIYAAKHLDKNDFCKIDMIGEFGGDHIGDITNIIFKHRDNFDFAKDAFPSFPHQEVVTGHDRPQASRYTLKNYGDYVFWLVGEVQSMSEKLDAFRDKPNLPKEGKRIAIKVSKRAMLLAAMVGQHDYVDWFSKILGNKESRKYAVQSAIDCINPLLDAGGEAEKLAPPALKIATAEMAQIMAMEDEKIILHDLLDRLDSLVAHFDDLCYPSRVSV